MARRSHVAFLVLAFAATSMAGCIENLTALASSDAEVSAMENRGAADAAAADWNENAELIGVMAFELTESSEERIMPDPEVGNGLAPAWWYVYCATSWSEAKAEAKGADGAATTSEKEMSGVPMVRAFKVTADGTVTSEDDAAAMAAGFDHEMAQTIEAWSVDSNDALASAKGDESFQKVAEGFNASVVEGVASHDGMTAWWFAAMSADGFVVATVDALTGELLEVESIDMNMEIPSFEWGARDPEMWTAQPVHLEAEGVAEPEGEPLQLPFSTSGPVFGPLEIVFDQMFPTDGLHWAILDSEGELVAVDHVRSWSGGSAYSADVELEDAGDYTFTLYYMSWMPGPVSTPLAQGVAYAFTLDLEPGMMEHDDEGK